MLRIIKILSFILLFCHTSLILSQQENSSIGGGIGFGSFIGSFPSQSVFGGNLHYEFQSPFTYFDKIQFHLSAAQKLEKFLPGNNRIEYFSYFYSVGTSIIFVQNPNENFYVNEGLGLIYLNDRSFSDINTWNLGILLSFNFAYQLNLHSKIGFNFDYGLTFTNTSSSYSLFLINYTYIL